MLIECNNRACRKLISDKAVMCPFCKHNPKTTEITTPSRNKLLNSIFSIYRSVVIFDIETSGLNVHRDEIIEFAAVLIKREENPYVDFQLDKLIKLNNGRHLSANTVKINGITEQMLSEHGESKPKICKQIADMLKSDNILLVAHNINFDYSFLKTMLNNEKYFYVLDGIDVLDTLTVIKDRKPYPHKLSDAIRFYNLQDSVTNSHRAIDDVIALFEVVKALSLEYDDLSNYINLVGFNPKYPVAKSLKIPGVKYVEQEYQSDIKLYNK